jgi:hypothetical protein
MKKFNYVTVKMLKNLGACEEGIELFLEIFPKGKA